MKRSSNGPATRPTAPDAWWAVRSPGRPGSPVAGSSPTSWVRARTGRQPSPGQRPSCSLSCSGLRPSRSRTGCPGGGNPSRSRPRTFPRWPWWRRSVGVGGGHDHSLGLGGCRAGVWGGRPGSRGGGSVMISGSRAGRGRTGWLESEQANPSLATGSASGGAPTTVGTQGDVQLPHQRRSNDQPVNIRPSPTGDRSPGVTWCDGCSSR